MSSGSDPLLELREVRRRFGDLEILKPTDLTIQAGDYVTITGASGSGKSTLLNLLGLLDRPTSGSVWIRGSQVDRLPDPVRSAIRGRTIGFVFQAFHLLASRTAVENVELGMLYQAVRPSLRRARALEALDTVGMTHRAGAWPGTLSGGERQRVAIARALAAEVQLLLADEPTGNLDSVTGDHMLDLFDTLNDQGQTLIVVTHDKNVSKRASRHCSMVDGLLSELI